MVVSTFTLDMDPNTLRRAFNDISDRPRLLVRALAGLGALYDLDLIGCSPIGDTLGTSRDIQFGSLPCNPPSDTPSHETRGATEEKETTSGPFVQEAKTRTVTDGAKNRKDNTKESLTGAMEKTEAKKHEDDDKKKWREFRLEDDEIFSKIKKISEALGLETPCSRHGTKHHVLMKILLGLEKDLAKKRNIAGAIAAKNAPKASTASDAEKVRTPCPHGGATVFKDTSTPPPLKEQTMSLHEGVTRANNPSSSQQPSPREQADNRSVGPNNMITLNSVRPTSKGPPDNENVDIVTEDENEDCEGRRSASTDSGAENEQTTSLQKAAAEEVAAEKRAAEKVAAAASAAQEANKLKTCDRLHRPNGQFATAQQISTGNDVAEIETVEKLTGDRDFENDEDSEELLITLEGLLNAEGMKKPWMLDEVGFHGGLRIWYLLTWRGFLGFDEAHIIWAAENSPHLSNHLDICGDAIVKPGDGFGSYGEIEFAEVDGDDVAQRWLPSSGDPRHPDLRDENKHDPYYRSDGEGYKVHNHCSLDDGGPITFELCDDVQPDEDERNAWFEECSEEIAFEGHG